ncbi:MAG: hypothetical protein OXJ56_04010 [Rhodospirillaceae bacterium]|nr:hypothetical protein [Rhodospirillaceae bacterium]
MKPMHSADDSVVGPCLDVVEPRLPDHNNGARKESRKHGKILDENDQRRTQLILERSAFTGVREPRLGFNAERGDVLVELPGCSTPREWLDFHPG